MSFSVGTILKFLGNSEPCTVYRVIEPNEVIERSPELNELVPHVKIEVMGWVPKQLLTKAIGSPDNVFGLDRLLKETQQVN